MAAYDFRSPRLHVEADLGPGLRIALTEPQLHYLVNVLRRQPGETVLIFNGRDGEWLGRLGREGKRSGHLDLAEQTRPQPAAPDLSYLFAPLKQARLDYMVQKAVEMGASRLVPVTTRHTQVGRLNAERMQANAVEAAEQCGILVLPEIAPLRPLGGAVAALAPECLLVFCDEDAEIADPMAALTQAAAGIGTAAAAHPPLAVLVGPEGGFADDERAALMARPRTLRLSLGPRILRADTAAVAALALVQAALGDWRPSNAAGQPTPRVP